MGTETQDKKIFYGWWIALLMMYTVLFTGGFGLYTFPVYVPRFQATFGWSRTQIVGAAAVWAVVFGLAGPFVGAFIQRLGARKVLVGGTLIFAAAWSTLSFITSLWQLYAVVALIGIACALTTLVPAQTVVTMWFDKKRGRAMGLVMMGVGLGGLALVPLVAQFIKLMEWRNALRLTSLLTCVFVIPPILLFLKNRPSDVGQLPDGAEPSEGDEGAAGGIVGVSANRAVRSAAFWLLFSASVLTFYI